MQNSHIPSRFDALRQATAPFMRFFSESAWSKLPDPQPSDICDFAVGNPHDMPLEGFVETLQHWIRPQNKGWFAYKLNEPLPRQVVAESLRRSHRMSFEPEDVFLTNGSFAGLAVALTSVVEPGEEVIFNSPPWFFYEALILHAGGKPVRVKVDPRTFDLDLEAIERQIHPDTRAIIVNTPNNPTGRIYPPDTLRGLADLLERANRGRKRPVYIIADEAYRQIIYDGRDYPSPAQYYPNTLVSYTYGKTLLTPGQRIGYVALPPGMPHREQLREALFLSQMMVGFAFPNALLQHALPDLENLSIDIPRLQRKRDRMVSALQEIGYSVRSPEGTFYLLPRSPGEDDRAFADLLAGYKIYVLPGEVVEMPGTFRISLTANEDMIERSLTGFAKAFERAHEEASLVKG
ncbi:MAG TPA: aminotransferase class I/II-fold pyridoxal phosphate-dependent enzyme [Spirochaetia bacterium]|nr:aminotransferase class I/II-fold pyridoxal phosphate-dependent enzyme [Spirochaetia bacterium]